MRFPTPPRFSEAGFLCVPLAVLALTLETRLTWNSEVHLPLPRSGTQDIHESLQRFDNKQDIPLGLFT